MEMTTCPNCGKRDDDGARGLLRFYDPCDCVACPQCGVRCYDMAEAETHCQEDSYGS